MEGDDEFRGAGLDEDPFEERPPPQKSPRLTLRALAAALVLPTCSGSPEQAAKEAVTRSDALLKELSRRSP